MLLFGSIVLPLAHQVSALHGVVSVFVMQMAIADEGITAVFVVGVDQLTG